MQLAAMNPHPCGYLSDPKCSDLMHVIAFIEDEDVIKKILKHLYLWDIKRKHPPLANAPPLDVFKAQKAFDALDWLAKRVLIIFHFLLFIYLYDIFKPKLNST